MQPFSPKQIRSYQESDARINIWEGAVRSGKTFISLIRFIKELREGPEGEYAFICRTYDSFRRNTLPQLVKLIGGDVKHYGGKREMHIYGKTIHVIGADDERAESKIRGPTFAGAYVDEATIIPESVFKMLISRCAMGGAKIFATTNPDSPFHWLKKDFLENNPDVKSWQFILDDNPELPENDKKYLRTQYRGLWYQRFIEGKWVQAEGSIYDFFDAKLHVIDYAPHHAKYYVVGVDYGTTNPCAFTLLGFNNSRHPNIWVEDEYYFDSKVHNRQKTDSEYAEDLQKFIANKAIKAIYVDPSAVSFRVELQRSGITNIFEADNEVIDGIRQVGDLLNSGTLKICKKCSHLMQEFQSYVWDSRSAITGVDKPLKQNDHLLDSLRYAVYTHMFAKDTKGMSPQEYERMKAEALGIGDNLPDVFKDPREYGDYSPRMF